MASEYWSYNVPISTMISFPYPLVNTQSQWTFSLNEIFYRLYFISRTKSKDNVNPIEIFRPAFVVFWSIVIVFVDCECGERLAQQFNEIDTEYSQSKFYFFPVDLQRMYLILMLDIQQPVYIRGYGNIVCTRDFFKEVTHHIKYSSDFFLVNSLHFIGSQTIHTGFSYFMTLRQMDGL